MSHQLDRTRQPTTRRRAAALMTALLCAACLTLLTGANGCPLFADESSDDAADASPPSSSSDLDIGGATGATWNLTYDKEVTLVIRSATKVASGKVKPGTGPVLLLGNIFDLDSFCWRTDVSCPHHILTTRTTVVQPTGAAGQFVIGYARRGPLSGINQTGILGKIAGTDISIPLEMSPLASNPCTLRARSAIRATAKVSSQAGLDAGAATEASATTEAGAANRATRLDGMSTVVYSGSCLAVGSGGAFHASDLLELSMKFTATRQ